MKNRAQEGYRRNSCFCPVVHVAAFPKGQRVCATNKHHQWLSSHTWVPCEQSLFPVEKPACTRAIPVQKKHQVLHWREVQKSLFHKLDMILFIEEEKYRTDKNYNNWRALSKRGVCTYFVAIFQVARNPLKFGMPILFLLKNVPVVFFFEESRKIWTKLHKNPPIVGLLSLRTKTLCMCVLRHWRGRRAEGGWGRLSRACLKPCFPACGKKTDIFLQKKSRHAKFQRIPSNLKNRTEIGTYASLWRSSSIMSLSTNEWQRDFNNSFTSWIWFYL